MINKSFVNQHSCQIATYNKLIICSHLQPYVTNHLSSYNEVLIIAAYSNFSCNLYKLLLPLKASYAISACWSWCSRRNLTESVYNVHSHKMGGGVKTSINGGGTMGH